MGRADIQRSAAGWERMWARLPTWRGVPCQQFPADMWRYAEILHELRPPWVLECGTADGGTALFLADTAESICCGRVISIDSDPRPVNVTHPRLTLLKGDAADPGTAEQVQALTGPARGLVLLDDDHTAIHVAAELDLYAPHAGYLIVQDTIMEHLPGHGHGPHEALAAWLPAHPEFTADPDPDPTQHPGGWLRRVSG